MAGLCRGARLHPVHSTTGPVATHLPWAYHQIPAVVLALAVAGIHMSANRTSPPLSVIPIAAANGLGHHTGGVGQRYHYLHLGPHDSAVATGEGLVWSCLPLFMGKQG